MGSKFGMKGREVVYNAEVSRRIESLRLQLNVRSTELAKAADVTPQMLRAYQIGTSRWPVFRLRLIADYLGVKLEQVMPLTERYETRVDSSQKQLW
jgi:transcriptional regulator with XRE-family HTH domain